MVARDAAGERWSHRNTGVSDGVWMKARRHMTMDDVQHGGVARRWFKLFVGISAGSAAMFLIGRVLCPRPRATWAAARATAATRAADHDHRAATDHDHRATDHDHRATDHDHRAADDHRRAKNDAPAGDDAAPTTTDPPQPLAPHPPPRRRPQVDGSHAAAAWRSAYTPDGGDAVTPSGGSDFGRRSSPTVQSGAGTTEFACSTSRRLPLPGARAQQRRHVRLGDDKGEGLSRSGAPERESGVADDIDSVTWAALEARITQSPLALGIQFDTRAPCPCGGTVDVVTAGGRLGKRRRTLAAVGVPIALGFGGAGWWLLLARRTAPADPAAPTSATVRVTRRKL